MVDGDRQGENAVRAPTRADLVRLCGDLNERNARYVVLGGMALIEMGLDRGTMDIDFLVDKDPDNIARMCDAIRLLPDGAANEVRNSDVADYNSPYLVPWGRRGNSKVGRAHRASRSGRNANG